MRRRIIVCCDGTWNEPYKDVPTNVAKTVRAIQPSAADGTPQIVFYDAGVGTGNIFDKIVGGGFGKGLGQNVQDGYLFIVTNYRPGDEIYLFGFSRGAFTARSIAGLLGVVGILRKEDLGRFLDAYKFYKTPKEERSNDLRKKLLPRELANPQPEVHFLGVWDTVGALGIPGPLGGFTLKRHKFFDVSLGKHIKRAYHALAIDERRKSFIPTLWDNEPLPGQLVEQVWFSGVHSNVGGGYEHTGLSDICWRWMLKKAAAAGLEINQPFVDDAAVSKPPSILHDSRRSILWKVLPGTQRELCATKYGTEWLHPTVKDRLTAARELIDPHPYDPPGLKALDEALKKSGKSRDDRFWRDA